MNHRVAPGRIIRCGILAVVLLGSLSALVPVAAQTGMPGKLSPFLTIDPLEPAVGQAATVTMTVGAVGGPLTLALVARFPLTATAVGAGQTLTTMATISPGGPGGVYTASFTFPTPGLWQIAVPTLPMAPGNSLTVTVLPAGQQQAAPACRTSDVTASVMWDPALGNRYAFVIVTNQGAAPCLLAGYPIMRIINTQGLPLLVAEQIALDDHAPGDVLLAPGQAATAQGHWVNYCPQTDSNALNLTLTLPDRAMPFTLPASAPPCLGPAAGVFTQEPFALGGDAAQVIHDYFAAINAGDFPTAYAAFGAAMQARQSYADFAAGFPAGLHDTPHITSVTTNGDQTVIGFWLSAQAGNDPPQRYSGTYTVAPEGGALKIVAATAATDM